MLIIVLGILTLVGSASAATTGKTTVISTAENGTQANALASTSTVTTSRTISDDGKYVVFSSAASNLVPNDTNGVADVFVKDLKTNKITLVSVAVNGTQANAACVSPAISGNGNFVVYQSSSTTLVADSLPISTSTGNPIQQLFLCNLLTNTTTIVSVATNGTMDDTGPVYPSISQTGRYVTWNTAAKNLVVNDTNPQMDVFVHDTVTGITTLCSVNSNGSQVSGLNWQSSVTADGRYVVFCSAGGLDPNDTIANSNDIYARDLWTNTTIWVSAPFNGTQVAGASMVPSITPDGKYLVFYSTNPNLVENGTTVQQIYLRNMLTNTTTVVSMATNGTLANGLCSLAVISGNGRFVVFQSDATNLVPNDINGKTDVFVRDLLTDVTKLVSVATNGTQGTGASNYASINSDGRYVVFSSVANDLVTNDTNPLGDIFVTDLADIAVYPGDDLASVIENILPGGIITIHGDNGTHFTYSGNLVLDKPLTIIGLGKVVFTAANASKPVLELTSNATGSVISGLTILGSSDAYGVLLNNVDNVTIIDSVIAGSIGLKELNSNNNTLDNTLISLDFVAPVVNADVGTGSYNTSKTVTLSSDSNATIFYTVDGTDPTPTSLVYSGPITIDASTVLKYIAVDEAGNVSPVYTQSYNIDRVAPTAVVNLNGGLFNADKTVTLSMGENGSIYYTTDGTTPTAASKKYTSPIVVSKTTTLKLVAVDEAGNLSPVYSQTYTIDKVKPTATANVKAGLYKATQKVYLKINEAGAIYYTINGATPTTASKKYTGAISVSKTTTVKFIAVDKAGNKSPVYTQKYTIDKVVPKVSSATPKSGATKVKRSSTLTIKFSETIKNSTNWSKIYVKDVKTGKKISLTKSIKGNVLTIKTTKKTTNTQYQVYIPTSAVKDTAGNNLAKAYTYKIKTGNT